MIDVTLLTDDLRPNLSTGYDAISNGEFFLDYSEDANKSHFLQFLCNVSTYNWRKKDEATLEDAFLNSRHIVNKLTAIGYMLHDYKDDNELKAVIAVDGKLSEVGASY